MPVTQPRDKAPDEKGAWHFKSALGCGLRQMRWGVVRELLSPNQALLFLRLLKKNFNMDEKRALKFLLKTPENALKNSEQQNFC